MNLVYTTAPTFTPQSVMLTSTLIPTTSLNTPIFAPWRPWNDASTLVGTPLMDGQAVMPSLTDVSLIQTTWVPHTQAHPILPTTVRNTNSLCGTRPSLVTPSDVRSLICLNNGWPLPTTMPGTWSPGVWPHPTPPATPGVICSVVLCPWITRNPRSQDVGHILWDVTQSPMLAKRRSFRWTISSLSDKFDTQATSPRWIPCT